MDGYLLNPATPRSSRLRDRSDECGSSVQWKAVPGILLFASVTAILIWQGNLDARADIKPEPGSGEMELYSPSWSSVRKLGSWPRLNISELRVNAGRFTMVNHDCPTLRWEVLPQASASTRHDACSSASCSKCCLRQSSRQGLSTSHGTSRRVRRWRSRT